MLKVIFFTLIVIALILLIIYIRSKTSNRLLINGAATLIIGLIVFYILIGLSFRFDSNSAARANLFVNNNAEWIGMIEADENQFHIFYNPDEDKYQTVYVEKLLIGYRSNISTHIYPHHEDSIRTIGTMNVEDDEGRFSAFMIETKDDDIRSIGLVDESGRLLESREINMNKPTKLYYEYVGNQTCFNCELVAFDKNMVAKYYYGYEHGDNLLSGEEYKWHKFK